MKTIRRFCSLWLSLALFLFGAQALATVSVVATTADLAAIARQVGGSSVQVEALAVATQDPHFVDARPNLALALSRADLLIVQGLDLEVGWLPTLQSGARNPKIITGAEGFLDASSFITPLEVAKGQVSRAQGDIHPSGNPHYLYDPRNAARVARGIAARLGKLDPDGAAGYASRAASFAQAAEQVAASFAAQFAGLPQDKRKVVVYHRSLIYLETWLGLVEAGAVEPTPGVSPDPAHVAKLMVAMRGQGVGAILSEEYYPQTTSKLLAEKTGAALIVIPGGAADGQSYLAHIQDVVGRLRAALAR